MTPDEAQAISLFKHQLKIRNFDAKLVDEMQKRLFAISYSIGIKDVEIEMMKVILRHLREHFSDFSLQEIASAFSFYGAKKILPDRSHFNSFDIVFISDVLTAYREYRNKAITKQKQLERQKELADENRLDIHDHELQKQSYENLLKFIQLNKRFPAGWNWEMVFHHLEREKLITDTNDEKRLFLENVIEDLREENTPKRFAELIEKETIKLECRKRRVKKYMEKYL